MISFYADAFSVMGGWITHARVWAHRRPVLARVLTVAALIGYFVFVQARAAHAAGFLPEGVDFIDSRGNSFSQYSEIDLAEGDVFTPNFVITNWAVDFLWSLQYFATGVMLWMFDFLLSFEWVAWLATPFNAVAEWMQGQLGTINWIPFALMISALVGGIALFVGRVAGGLWEMFVAAVIAVLALGALANPVATLTATGGVLDKAQDFGGELATSIVVDPDAQTGDASLSSALNATLMDIFVRTPYQVISYAQVLPDECQGDFDTFIQTGEPQKSLTECAPEAAVFAHSNPGAMNVLNAMVNGAGVYVMFFFALIIAVLLMIAVVFFLVAALKSMGLVYLAILPINRQPLWKSISDSFMGALSLVVLTVCLSLYLKLTSWIMGQTGWLPHQLRMVILVIFLIVVIILVVRARKSTLRAGHGLAQHLSKLGLGMAPGPKGSNALLKMSTVSSLANTAHGLWKNRPTGSGSSAPAKPQAPSPQPAPAGPVTLTQVRTPDSGDVRSSRTALGARASQKAIGAAGTVGAIAKGAASGGTGGAVAAGATVVGKSLVSKAGSKAATTAKDAVSRRKDPKPAPQTQDDVVELKVIKVAESEPRIEVDSNGVATARRKGSGTVYDVSSLPPRSVKPPSQRALERRRQLENFRPKELTR